MFRFLRIRYVRCVLSWLWHLLEISYTYSVFLSYLRENICSATFNILIFLFIYRRTQHDRGWHMMWTEIKTIVHDCHNAETHMSTYWKIAPLMKDGGVATFVEPRDSNLCPWNADLMYPIESRNTSYASVYRLFTYRLVCAISPRISPSYA
jgi:hypothetical protein